MILYDYRRSSAAYRVRIALNLKGLAYQQVVVDLLNSEQSGGEHLVRNPQGLVPVLEHQGQQISQSLAICEYLDGICEENLLVWGDALQQARIRSLAQQIACDIHPLNNLRVLKYLTGELGLAEEQKMAWYQHWIANGFAALEAQLPEQGYCAGDKLSLVDVCLVPQLYNAERFEVPLEVYPKLTAIGARLRQLEAFSLAHPDCN